MESRLSDYIEQHCSPEPEYLQAISRYTHLHVLNAHMLSGRVQGRFLSMLSRMARAKHILEIGTFTGYSALCLAEGLPPDGHLLTIERNDELEPVIRRHLALSPYEKQIELRIGSALDIVPMLPLEQQFDMVFIDGDKREYAAYLDIVLPRLKHGGCVLADNTLWDGHIIDPLYDKDAQTQGLRLFNNRVAQDQQLEKVILPLRDGLTLIRRLGE